MAAESPRSSLMDDLCRRARGRERSGLRIWLDARRHAIMSPAMKHPNQSFLLFVSVVLLAFFSVAQNPSQPPQPSGQPQNPMAPAQKLVSEGKLDEAIAFYKNALQSDPQSWQAYLGMGSALDLKGDYAAARQDFQKAIDMTSGSDKVRALRSMAVSYAFTNQPSNAAKYEE